LFGFTTGRFVLDATPAFFNYLTDE